MYYMGFSYREVYNMPVSYKGWFINRVVKELNNNKDEGANSRALHQNSPEVRALSGRNRENTPSRLRRFT